MDQLELLNRYQELSGQVQEIENGLRNSPVRRKLRTGGEAVDKVDSLIL